MITLTNLWNSGHCVFPAGTVFIPHLDWNEDGSQVYSYGTPNGGYGEVLLDMGVTPGE